MSSYIFADDSKGRQSPTRPGKLIARDGLPSPLDSHFAGSYLHTPARSPDLVPSSHGPGPLFSDKPWPWQQCEGTAKHGAIFGDHDDILNDFSKFNEFTVVPRDETGSRYTCTMPPQGNGFRLDTRRKAVVSGMMNGGAGVYTLAYRLRNLKAYSEAPIRCGISIVTAISEEFVSLAIFGHNDSRRQSIYKVELHIDGNGSTRDRRRFDIGNDDVLDFDLQLVIHEQADHFGVCFCDFSVFYDKTELFKHTFQKACHAEWYAFCNATDNALPRSCSDHLCSKVEGQLKFVEACFDNLPPEEKTIRKARLSRVLTGFIEDEHPEDDNSDWYTVK